MLKEEHEGKGFSSVPLALHYLSIRDRRRLGHGVLKLSSFSFVPLALHYLCRS